MNAADRCCRFLAESRRERERAEADKYRELNRRIRELLAQQGAAERKGAAGLAAREELRGRVGELEAQRRALEAGAGGVVALEDDARFL